VVAFDYRSLSAILRLFAAFPVLFRTVHGYFNTFLPNFHLIAHLLRLISKGSDPPILSCFLFRMGCQDKIGDPGVALSGDPVAEFFGRVAF
jgi:hypothetical protein